MSVKSIKLFWWSEPRLMKKPKENYGDLLSSYIVKKLSNKKVVWIQPKKIPWYRLNSVNYLSTGSIIHHANKKSIIWGSGIIDRKQEIAQADFRAVRGPQTRKFLLDLGYECPEIYGDPAFLLPRIYKPEVEKKFKIGIIPHYNDFNEVFANFKNNPSITVIDMMTYDIEKTTHEILECEKIISSSLHGIIVSHAYKIPAVCVKFSDRIFGDGIKYQDYYESVGIIDYNMPFVKAAENKSDLNELFMNNPALPEENAIKKLQNDLLASCPFIN